MMIMIVIMTLRCYVHGWNTFVALPVCCWVVLRLRARQVLMMCLTILMMS